MNSAHDSPQVIASPLYAKPTHHRKISRFLVGCGVDSSCPAIGWLFLFSLGTKSEWKESRSNQKTKKAASRSKATRSCRETRWEPQSRWAKITIFRALNNSGRRLIRPEWITWPRPRCIAESGRYRLAYFVASRSGASSSKRAATCDAS